MAEEEITLIISSRKTAEEGGPIIDMMKNTCGCPLKIIFVTNDNSMSLTELYGNMMGNKEIKSKIMCFIHDDCTPLRSGWGKEIVRLFRDPKNKSYGIIGIAGSDYFDDKDADEAASRWWAYKGHTWGQVLHRDLENNRSWLTEFSPLLDHDLEEVCVIDGLFMAFERTRIKKNFDKAIGPWDFYDIDTCLANYLEGVKIGVTTNIRFAHNSLGEMKPGWYTNRDIVCEKYKDYFPIQVPKKKKKKS